MGNSQVPLKRERTESGGRKSSSNFPDDDQCPVEMKIAKSSPHASMHSLQFENASEYPVVIKWTGKK